MPTLLPRETTRVRMTPHPARARTTAPLAPDVPVHAIRTRTPRCYYVLDGVHDRLNLTERTRALFEMHRKYQPLGVGYERYGMQADIEHIEFVQGKENYRFRITELGGQMPKNDRIRRLVPVFEQGRMYFPHQIIKKRQDNTAHDLVDVFKRLEYQPFPVAEHDDMLDCLSRILDPDLQAAFPRDNVSAWKGASSFAQTDFDVFAW